MNKLWGNDGSLNPKIEQYTVGNDVTLDLQLLPYDIAASKAHAQALERIGLLTDNELQSLQTALDDLLKEYLQGHVAITQQDEDCHTVIEKYLVDTLGDTGKKIHTGRSRNDQVLTATRLLVHDALLGIRKSAVDLAREFLDKAKKHRDIPFPGYTHTQQAMLSSIGHYYGSFVESLINDIEFLDAASYLTHRNPLGSAAGFGVVFPLERQFTTTALGFDSLQVNSLYCQASRGKFESIVLESLQQLMMTVGRYANDMLLFTANELNYFSVPQSLTTGSSIMPQKHNLDGLEIVRGNMAVVQANHQMIQSLSAKLLSGYNRDLQLTKRPLIESLRVVRDSLEVITLYVQSAEPNEEAISRAIVPSIAAADRANELVLEGQSFRDAYEQVKQDNNEQTSTDWNAMVTARKSIGSPGNLQLDGYEKRLDELS